MRATRPNRASLADASRSDDSESAVRRSETRFERRKRDTEARLSQLTRWVLEAEGKHLSYGLRLPGTRIAPSRGATHQHACLKALALHQT